MKKPSLSTSILATISYSAIFHFPLTEKELKNRLMGIVEVSDQELLKELKTLPQLIKVKEYWVLKGHESDVELREKRRYFSQFKKAELQTLISRLKKIPTISSVYVTGSLAMDSASSLADDIDLLVVTKPNTMWLTRLIVVLWTTLIGKYRLHVSNGEWGWCFNLWLDQNHLEIPKDDRSVYLAYEVVQAKLELGTQNELRRANGWVTEYINYSSVGENSQNYGARTMGEGGGTPFWTILLLPIDWVCYGLQKLYMQPRRSREKVGRGFAFFHPRDTKGLILKKWREELTDLKLSEKEISELIQVFEKGRLV